MKEKIKSWMFRHNQAALFLYAVVGGYLLYLAYQLFTADAGSANPVLLYIAAALFVIFGLSLLLIGGIAVIFGYYKEKLPKDDTPTKEASEEE